MPQGEALTLRQRMASGSGPARFFVGVDRVVPMDELAGGTSLQGPLAELAGRSVLLDTVDQLSAGLALIDLDGVASRIVVAPPDLPPAYRTAIAATAEVDAVVSDCDPAIYAGLGVPLFVRCLGDVAPGPAKPMPRGSRRTEWLLLTSGTTGVPKMVRHDVASLTAPIKPAAQSPVWGTFYDIRRYGGLQIFLRAVVGGGSLILSNAAEPVADHLVRLAEHGVTHLSGTPSHWRRALMSAFIREVAPGYVRLSGEIADQPILDTLRAAFPQAAVGHAYASTEAGVGFEVNDGRAGFPAHFVGAVGDVDIKIQDGSLRLRSDRTASGYVGRDAAALLDADGFVDTGDMVELRGDRYFFVGRVGGIVNVGGLKVHPEEVEAIINRHPAVWGSLVRARRNPITGAVVVAEVVLRDREAAKRQDGRNAEIEAEIVALCREHLAPYKVPASIRFVPFLNVSAATGKLQRNA